MSVQQHSPGLWSIDVYSGSGVIVNHPLRMTDKLVRQVLRLKAYRIQMNSDISAEDAGIIYFDIKTNSGQSVLSSNHLIDSNPEKVLFPIPIEPYEITLRTDIDIPLYMRQDADSSLFITVYDSKLGVIDICNSVKRIFLSFETEFGALVI